MPKETMTGRERWRAVLSRQKPDRIPMDIWATDETFTLLRDHLACDLDGVLARLHIDMPVTVTGTYVGPPLPPNQDVFGFAYHDIQYGTGAYHEPINTPLAQFQSVEEIEAGYTWPNPDWWDYSHLPGELEGQEHRAVKGGGSEPMLWYNWLRGNQQAFMDLLVNPDIVHYCLDKLFDLAYQQTLRIFETIPGRVDFTYIAEDIGGQNTVLYPPDAIREFFWPGMKRMMDLTHQNGAYVFTHSDGSFRDMIPELIQLGVDVLNPIQWRCPGMEREGLVRDFGQQLAFHGAVDNQQTLPFGTPDDVRNEVLDNFRIFAPSRYILAPCHNLQAVTPMENIIAMYDTGYEHGWQ